MCVRDIEFTYFCDFSIEYQNCSDRVIYRTSIRDFRRARSYAVNKMKKIYITLSEQFWYSIEQSFPTLISNFEIKFVLNNERSKFSFSCPCGLRYFSTLDS
jgi:hypothetical protein